LIKLFKYILFLIIAYQGILSITFFAGKINIRYEQIDILLHPVEINNFILIGLVYSFIALLFIKKENYFSFLTSSKKNVTLYFTSVIFIIGSILFWHPLTVYASSPSAFEFPANYIFSSNILFFLELLILFLIIFIIAPKRIKQWLTFLSIFIAFVSFINSQLFPLDLRFFSKDTVHKPALKAIV